ncbi:GGDEF domain-containing protein [Fusibacter bizertensis]
MKSNKSNNKVNRGMNHAMNDERLIKNKILLLNISIVAVMILSVLASVFYQTDRFYTHFFYIPIAMSAIWRPKWTIPLGIAFSFYHILLEMVIKSQFTLSIMIRSAIILLIALILNNIWKRELNYQAQINNLTYKSSHDALTKVYNWGYFQWLLGTGLRLPVVIIVIDIDGLKKVNDQYGHPAGDLHIIASAKILKRSLRFGDTLARLGGDEFGILAQSCTEEGAKEILARIEALVEQYNVKQQLGYPLSLSMGYESNRGGSTLDETLKRADQKMYENKRRKYEVANETIKGSL